MKFEDRFMLDGTIQLNKVISSQIAKVKVYVMYAGKNRNQTHFSKEMIEEKIVPSMYGMPIVGEFLREKSDFGGHGGKVIITDDGIEYEQTTVAYGFIPESAEIKWETVLERDGMTEREYLVTDAYVWYKRFPELECILDEPRNQSMEIEVRDAEWNDEINAFDIKDAELLALCVLGLDVEPCFESARIGRFALENMKFEISEMAKELKETLLKSEVKEMSQEEKVVTEETIETTEEVIETVEEEIATEETTTEEPATEETEEIIEEEATAEEATEEIQEEEAVEETEDEEIQEEAEEVEEETEEQKSETEEEFSETQEEVTETETENNETVDYAVENEALKAKIEAYEAELEELRSFKSQIELQEKEEVINSFSGEFTDEELEPIKNKVDEYSKEELEVQLFALLGKKQIQYSVGSKTKKETEKVLTVATYQEEETLPSWAKAIEEYTKKI